MGASPPSPEAVQFIRNIKNDPDWLISDRLLAWEILYFLAEDACRSGKDVANDYGITDEDWIKPEPDENDLC